MEERHGNSYDFIAVADSVFQTLLTITTILSGVYVSITFGWFAQAMAEPHPGEPMKPEMLSQAMVGIILGLIFIWPLVLILVAWAFSKFRNSTRWRTAAWSGLIYCLTQDFIGLFALLGISMIAAGAVVESTLIVTGASVILIPPIVGTIIGYRVGNRYRLSKSGLEKRHERPALTTLLMIILILVIQALLGVFLVYSVGAL